MDIEPSDLIVGLMMLVFGVVGLILAAGAVDDEMYVFGLSLFGFACLFVVRTDPPPFRPARRRARGGPGARRPQ